MIWNILSKSTTDVVVPSHFNKTGIYTFIESVLDEQGDAKFSSITLDFSALEFIEPGGVVILSNVIEYLRQMKVRVTIRRPARLHGALIYLDDAGFFKRYLSKPLRTSANLRSTTIPLEHVKSERTSEYLHHRLIPWVGQNVGLSADSLDTIRVCLEEIFQNISDHSGKKIGCAFAQHYPNKNEIQIVISDFGIGIPKRVAEKVQGLADQYAILEACKEGFTTKSNVRNRGAGLPNLMRYVTHRNKGTVLLASGRGELSAVPERQRMKVTPRPARGFYPGTSVTTILRTDTIEAVAQDVEPEEFAW